MNKNVFMIMHYKINVVLHTLTNTAYSYSNAYCIYGKGNSRTVQRSVHMWN